MISCFIYECNVYLLNQNEDNDHYNCHRNGHTQLWLFVNDRFEFLILQKLYISIFESPRIEHLEIRIYEKRPQTRGMVAMATNICSEGVPSGIFSENLKKSKLSILEIRTFDSKPTHYKSRIATTIRGLWWMKMTMVNSGLKGLTRSHFSSNQWAISNTTLT